MPLGPLGVQRREESHLEQVFRRERKEGLCNMPSSNKSNGDLCDMGLSQK